MPVSLASRRQKPLGRPITEAEARRVYDESLPDAERLRWALRWLAELQVRERALSAALYELVRGEMSIRRVTDEDEVRA